MKDISNLLSQAWGYNNYFILNFFSPCMIVYRTLLY